MFSTRLVLTALRGANPLTAITEDHIRHAIRRGIIAPPTTVAGRYLWTQSEVSFLATALGLEVPAIGLEVRDAQ